MSIIMDDAKELMLEKIKDFRVADEDAAKRSDMRKEFVATFTPEFMKNLAPDKYFPGMGNKDDCIGYQLEWATRPLGSIKGGSMAKYGDKEQFREIKKLFIHLAKLADEQSVFYQPDGELAEASKKLIAESLNIKGMKAGRTVLGKLLSIYYPNTFIPFFTTQGHYLDKMVADYSDDSFGLEAYIKNNYLFLKIKEELLTEPAFVKEVSQKKITNDFFYKFVYACFPLPTDDGPEAKPSESNNRINALECEHYQKLIHRNFDLLFKGYRYYDEEYQKTHGGHYMTEDAGIMDFLCVDENDFVVIELKRRGTDETLGQLCRYMGWVKENLAKENQKVCGLIVSESKDVRLEYAIKVVPNVTLKQMRLSVSVGDFKSKK